MNLPLLAKRHETVYELWDGRPQDNYEQPRQDEKHQGKEQLDGGFARSLFCCLPSSDAHLVGLGPE